MNKFEIVCEKRSLSSKIISSARAAFKSTASNFAVAYYSIDSRIKFAIRLALLLAVIGACVGYVHTAKSHDALEASYMETISEYSEKYAHLMIKYEDLEKKYDEMVESQEAFATTIDSTVEDIESTTTTIEALDNAIKEEESVTYTAAPATKEIVTEEKNVTATKSTTVQTASSTASVENTSTNGSVNKNITSPSGLSTEEFDAVIKDRLEAIGQYNNSSLVGMGSALVALEETYGINGLFCLAVASYESGHGTTSQSINNPFGMMSSSGLIKYSSIPSAVDAWGSNMYNNYIGCGLTTLNSIANKYCPGSTVWASNVQSFINTYASIYEKLY